MTNISKSPDRGMFQLEAQLKKLEEDPNNESVKAMIEFIKKWQEEDAAIERTDEWKENNMEYDMRTCDWFIAKVRNSDIYAQNLYSAMCNMRWQKLDVIPILTENLWSCSWRSSGGIVADLLGKGDYIDWYCSGIRGGTSYDADDLNEGYVPEGHVTDEIANDLKQLGWVPVPWPEDK